MGATVDILRILSIMARSPAPPSQPRRHGAFRVWFEPPKECRHELARFVIVLRLAPIRWDSLRLNRTAVGMGLPQKVQGGCEVSLEA